MPCYTVTTVQLKLKSEIVRMDLLKEVVQRVTGRVIYSTADKIVWGTGSYDKRTEVITERSEQAANNIRQTYAAELTKRTLGRAGWRVTTVQEGR